MRISRLRLQLAAWFAPVFLLGLGAADFALFTSLRRSADARFTEQVAAAAAGFAQAVRREHGDTPGGVAEAAAEALKEWPADSNGFVVYTADGARAATRGPAALTRLVPPLALLPPGERAWDVPLDAEGELRLAVARSAAPPAFSVVALRPTASLREANERLALWLALSAPLVVLLALVGGYMLARRALAPLTTMTHEITAIAPQDLNRRLNVRTPPDELDALADQFNRLLERLARAQARNRRFLAQAAHQLRTPLTVIRGETGLALERPRSVEEHRDLLRRVALAADQMTHRVDDLLLLAQAEAGDRPPLSDDIEVDGLVLETVDLMRGRAHALGRQLELGAMEASEIRGNEVLVREALLELLENACRHGDATHPIRVSTRHGPAATRVEVSSAGAPVAATALEDGTGTAEATGADRPGLGLSIVRWIAAVHGGTLSYRREDGMNTFALELAGGSRET